MEGGLSNGVSKQSFLDGRHHSCKFLMLNKRSSRSHAVGCDTVRCLFLHIYSKAGAPGPSSQRLQWGALSHSPASFFSLLTLWVADSPGLFQAVHAQQDSMRPLLWLTPMVQKLTWSEAWQRSVYTNPHTFYYRWEHWRTGMFILDAGPTETLECSSCILCGMRPFFFLFLFFSFFYSR